LLQQHFKDNGYVVLWITRPHLLEMRYGLEQWHSIMDTCNNGIQENGQLFCQIGLAQASLRICIL